MSLYLWSLFDLGILAVFEKKKKVLGSKLRTKLVLAFITLSLVPTILLFFIATRFITSSIERWFSIQVEGSLQESLVVAQIYYQNASNNALYYARQMSHIPDLLQALIALRIGKQIPRGIDSPRHTHPAGLRDLPEVIVNLPEFHSFLPTLSDIQNDAGVPDLPLIVNTKLVVCNRLDLLIFPAAKT
jgi:hypothetical protein